MKMQLYLRKLESGKTDVQTDRWSEILQTFQLYWLCVKNEKQFRNEDSFIHTI